MKIIIAGVVCLMASSANSIGLIDRMHSLAEQAWESEYIPESTVPVVPLTDYNEFEVVELFRAETIQELEASLTDGYPYSWLEEALKDESIPWEDRYWLDRRVRAAISQNLHTFYDAENNPVHVDADGVFPGEYYWREHMIVDPADWNVPESLERPAAAAWWDIGYIFNPFGRKVGDLALPVPMMAMSRDGEISVISTGGNSPEYPNEQPYACFMYSDGTYLEIPLNVKGMYSATVSQDGSIAAFGCVRRGQSSVSEEENQAGPVYIFDRDANLMSTIFPPVQLEWCWRPAISADGMYLCHTARGANTCLINCINGNSEILAKPTGIHEQITNEYGFSPDGRILNLGGSTTARTMEICSGDVQLYNETGSRDNEEQPSTVVRTSNDGTTTSLTTRRGNRPDFYWELVVYLEDQVIYSNRITAEIQFFPIQTDISPNGNYLIVNPQDACHGYPSAFGYEEVYNLPLIAISIKGR